MPAIPPVTTRGLNNENRRRRHREVTDLMLKFQHDDSRVRTLAEVAAGVTPVNYAYPFGHVLRYGMVEGTDLSSDINSPIFDNMMLVAAANKGMTVHFPCGDWRGNFLVNTDNVIVEGEGGVGENDQTCLRPYATGNATITLRFSDGRINRKCGIRALVISGDDGSENQANVALGLYGGTVHFSAHNFELMDGIRSLHIEAEQSLPVTTCWFSQFNIRTDASTSNSRSIYMRRKDSDHEYVTSIFFAQGHINGPTLGFWLELDATGSPGLEFHGMQLYVDCKPGHGVKLAAGNETCSLWDCNLDPGNVAAVIVSRPDTSKNPANIFQGVVTGQAGQQLEFSDSSVVEIPPELNMFQKKAWFGETWHTLPMHFVNTSAPFDWTPGTLGTPGSAANALPAFDLDTNSGPLSLLRSDFSIKTVGKGRRIAEGTNAKMGLSNTMVAGAVTVNTTAVTKDSRIFVTRQEGDTNPGGVYISARTAGQSFTISSTNAADTGRVAWELVEPA